MTAPLHPVSRAPQPLNSPAPQLKRAVFLDRDGVINQNRVDHVKSWEEFVFLPGVFAPLRLLAQTSHPIVVISNQAVIGRGLTSQASVEQINLQMSAEIAGRGGRVDGVYYCPHRPEDNCDCRKPRPGMLLRAAREMALDLSRSFLVGDAVSDIEAALAVGCSPIFVLTGRGQQQYPLLQQRGLDHIAVVRDLAAAVAIILEKQ